MKAPPRSRALRAEPRSRPRSRARRRRRGSPRRRRQPPAAGPTPRRSAAAPATRRRTRPAGAGTGPGADRARRASAAGHRSDFGRRHPGPPLLRRQVAGPADLAGAGDPFGARHQPVGAGVAGHADARAHLLQATACSTPLHLRAGRRLHAAAGGAGLPEAAVEEPDADEAAPPRLHAREPAASRHPRQLERGAAAMPARLQLRVRDRRLHHRRPRPRPRSPSWASTTTCSPS